MNPPRQSFCLLRLRPERRGCLLDQLQGKAIASWSHLDSNESVIGSGAKAHTEGVNEGDKASGLIFQCHREVGYVIKNQGIVCRSDAKIVSRSKFLCASKSTDRLRLYYESS